MLSGEGKEKGENTAIGLISKKATLHVQHTFFVHFFVVVLHDYNVKLPETSWLVTRFMEEITYVFLSTFCSLLLILTSVAGSVSHFLTAATKLSCCSSKKNVFSFSRWLLWSISYFLFFSVSVSLFLYSKFVDMAINLSLILQTTRIQKQLPLSFFFFYWLFSCLCFTILGWLCDFPPK